MITQTKTCEGCGLFFESSQWDGPARWGTRRFCTPKCAYKNRGPSQRRPVSRTLEKLCEDCEGPLTGIRSDKRFCTECAYQRKKRQQRQRKRIERTTEEYKESYRAWCLKTKYGLTTEQFDDLLTSQGGRCKICGADNPQWTKDWHVDHDHVAGQVRGILCHKCNLMIGLAMDDPLTLLSAAEYLKGENYSPPNLKPLLGMGE